MECLAQEIPMPLPVIAGRFRMKDLSLLPVFVFFFPTFCCLLVLFPNLFLPASRAWDNWRWSSFEEKKLKKQVLSLIPVSPGSVHAPQVSFHCCNCQSRDSLQAYLLYYSQELFSNPLLKKALISHLLGFSQVAWSHLLLFFHINHIHIYYGCKYAHRYIPHHTHA